MSSSRKGDGGRESQARGSAGEATRAGVTPEKKRGVHGKAPEGGAAPAGNMQGGCKQLNIPADLQELLDERAAKAAVSYEEKKEEKFEQFRLLNKVRLKSRHRPRPPEEDDDDE